MTQCMVRPCVARGIFDLADSGLASMYPASFWSFLLRAIMDISAPAISLPVRPRGPFGSPVFASAGKTVFSISSFSLADLGGKLLGLLLSGHRDVPLFDPADVPSSRPCGVACAARAGLVRIGRHTALSARQDVTRPHLDEVEHDAIFKPVGVSLLVSLSLRSRGPWPAPPRRCVQVCWQVQSPAHCDAGASWPHQSKTLIRSAPSSAV